MNESTEHMADAEPDREQPTRRPVPGPAVVHAVLAGGASFPTFEQIAKTTGLSYKTVSNVVSRHAPTGLLARRPLRLGPACGAMLSFSLGTESLRCAVVDANGRLWCEMRADARADQLAMTPQALLQRVVLLAADVLEEAVQEAELVGELGALPLIGVSSAWPTPLSRRGHAAEGHALSHPDWFASPASNDLPARIAEAFGAPFTPEKCHALNDVNADVLAVAFARTRGRYGEQPDPPREERLTVVVRVGGGIGAGTIIVAPHRNDRLAFIDSRIISGTTGFAGELGHLPVARSDIDALHAGRQMRLADIDYDGWACSCGAVHHLEAVASAAALMRRLEASGYVLRSSPAEPWTPGLEDALADNDHLMRRAQQDIGQLLGHSMASAILMYDPYSVTLTGFLARPEVINGIRREQWVWGTLGDSVLLDRLTGEDNAYSGVRGAALAAIRARVYRRFEVLLGSERERQKLTVPIDLPYVERLRRSAHT